MKKHLTFKDDKSDKFWSIETSDTSFTVTYGKTGTEGQASTKDFDTEKKCLKEAEKLVSEKLKKGYIVSGEAIVSSSKEPRMSSENTSTIEELNRLLTTRTFFVSSALSEQLVSKLTSLGEVEDQLEVVKIFRKASKSYDDGHRPYEGTTMDVMLDRVFPSFETDAILKFLQGFKKLAYFTTDGMYELLPIALSRATNTNEQNKVADFIKAFFLEALDVSDPEIDLLVSCLDKLRIMQDRLPEFAEFEQMTKKAETQKNQQQQLQSKLKSASSTELETIIISDGVALCHANPNSGGFEHALIRNISLLRIEVLADFLQATLKTCNTYTVTPSLATLFLRDPNKASQIVQNIAKKERSFRLTLMRDLSNLIRWASGSSKDDNTLNSCLGQAPSSMVALKGTLEELTKLDLSEEPMEAELARKQLASATLTKLIAIVQTSGYIYKSMWNQRHPAEREFHETILRFFDQIPTPVFAMWADSYLERGASEGLECAMAYFFLKDMPAAHNFILTRGFIHSSNNRGLLNEVRHLTLESLSWDEKNLKEKWDTNPWMAVLINRPDCIKAIAKAIKALAPAFDRPFDRIK